MKPFVKLFPTLLLAVSGVAFAGGAGTFQHEGKTYPLDHACAFDGSQMNSQSGIGWYTLTQHDAKRVEGTFRSKVDDDDDDGDRYDFMFALDLSAAADLGTSLPADDGEPVKAFFVHHAALKRASSMRS